MIGGFLHVLLTNPHFFGVFFACDKSEAATDFCEGVLFRLLSILDAIEASFLPVVMVLFLS
jgi:hypothetical protein